MILVGGVPALFGSIENILPFNSLWIELSGKSFTCGFIRTITFKFLLLLLLNMRSQAIRNTNRFKPQLIGAVFVWWSLCGVDVNEHGNDGHDEDDGDQYTGNRGRMQDCFLASHQCGSGSNTASYVGWGCCWSRSISKDFSRGFLVGHPLPHPNPPTKTQHF